MLLNLQKDLITRLDNKIEFSLNLEDNKSQDLFFLSVTKLPPHMFGVIKDVNIITIVAAIILALLTSILLVIKGACSIYYLIIP
jgi:hypothetical protein